MKLICFVLIAISLFSISARPAPDAVFPEITAGLIEATAGLDPRSGAPSGWYTSEVTLQILGPADTLANGKPLKNGKLTISEEGQHEIELQPGPFGQANRVTQSIWIDKTPPRVRWQTEQNTAFSGFAILSAEITDATSGICHLESSSDHGRSWETQLLAAGMPIVHETTWLLHRDFTTQAKGAQIFLLRAWDCAGNVSPGEVLVLRVN